VVSRSHPTSPVVQMRRLVWVGPLTVVASIVAVLIVRILAVMVLQPEPTYAPLGWFFPILDTAILVTFAVLVFGAMARALARPIRAFRITSLVVLLFSFLPVLAITQEPMGGDWPEALALMTMHIAAWAVTATMLTTLTTAVSTDALAPEAASDR
jgi:hypothetical protein